MTEDQLERIEEDAINAQRKALEATGMHPLTAQMIATWVVRDRVTLEDAIITFNDIHNTVTPTEYIL
jgi:hypothetical protein